MWCKEQDCWRSDQELTGKWTEIEGFFFPVRSGIQSELRTRLVVLPPVGRVNRNYPRAPKLSSADQVLCEELASTLVCLVPFYWKGSTHARSLRRRNKKGTGFLHCISDLRCICRASWSVCCLHENRGSLCFLLPSLPEKFPLFLRLFLNSCPIMW